MNRIPLQGKILKENDRIAAELRDGFAASGTLCLNLISSPGAGKTSLLERTLEAFGARERVGVLTGDIQTDNDAVRLARFGFPGPRALQRARPSSDRERGQPGLPGQL